MKILVLCYEYPPIGGGGGRVAQGVAEQLVARGHEVRVQTAGMSHLPAHETIGGVEVFRTQSFRRREDTCAVHEMGLYVLTSFLPTLRHLREWRPDVMHAHFAMPTGVLAWAAHALTHVPYVLTAHLGDVPGGVPEQTDTLFKFVGPLARRVWQRATAATAVSSFVRELAMLAYRRPVETILNGVDLTKAEPPPNALLSATRRLAFVGRFNRQKRPDLLIETLDGLTDLTWKLTMVGDGPLMLGIRRDIKKRGLRNRVKLMGWLGAAEVQTILRDSDIFCMPSTSEGMPLAAVEALKNGLAILASDIPGVKDVVDHGVNGYLVPVGNVQAFAHKLRWLLESEETLLAMKHASWQKAREFDLQTIVGQYEQVLQKAAAKEEPPSRGEAPAI